MSLGTAIKTHFLAGIFSKSLASNLFAAQKFCGLHGDDKKPPKTGIQNSHGNKKTREKEKVARMWFCFMVAALCN